jgi:hypothetical protein
LLSPLPQLQRPPLRAPGQLPPRQPTPSPQALGRPDSRPLQPALLQPPKQLQWLSALRRPLQQLRLALLLPLPKLVLRLFSRLPSSAL